MLQKDYSDKRKMFKYILVIPIIASMLMYSSCSEEKLNTESQIKSLSFSTQESTSEKNEIKPNIIITASNADDLKSFESNQFKGFFNEHPELEKLTLEVIFSPDEELKKSIKSFSFTFSILPENIDKTLPAIEEQIRNIGNYLDDKIEVINQKSLNEVLGQTFANNHSLTKAFLNIEGKEIENTIDNIESLNVPSDKDIAIKYNTKVKDSNAKVFVSSHEENPGNQDSEKVPFAYLDKIPTFPGCEDAKDPKLCFGDKLNEHIRKYFNYPEEAQLNNIQGRVFVQFTIQKDGTIGNIRLRSPHQSLEDATRKIFEKIPRLIPGEVKGEKVDALYSIPVTYKIQ